MTARQAVRWLAVASFGVLLGCGGTGGAGGASDGPSTFGGSGPATSGGSGDTTSGGSTGDEEIIELRTETGQLGQMFFNPDDARSVIFRAARARRSSSPLVGPRTSRAGSTTPSAPPVGSDCGSTIITAAPEG